MTAHTSISQPKLTWWQRLARQQVLQALEATVHGTINFSDVGLETTYGRGVPEGLNAEWHVTDPRFYSELAHGGSLGFAEAYLKGYWQADDLTSLLRVLYRNMQDRSQGQVTAAISNALQYVIHRWQGNTVTGSKRHIAAHYDISNDFFELFLDSTLMYSSAFFTEEAQTLEAASIAKLDLICDKLALKPGEHVLEIGTGWGGFALHALAKYDIQLTTTTISNAQYRKAAERIQAAGLADRVRLIEEDYRHLSGTYDKLVSIEMIEAVGERFLDTYFRKCGELLKPGGRFVLQGIIMPEQRYEYYRRNVDFIQRYIFPGGFLPSVAAIQQSVGSTTNLRLAHVEDLSPHYARTLAEWRDNFFSRIEEVRALGFDDRFIRMWEYYLCYCEAAFREQAVRVVQMVWDQPQ